MLFEETVDFGYLFVFELEGEPGFDVAVEFVLAEPHGGLIDEVGSSESISGFTYLSYGIGT